eukprot:TRINITY_DN11762_c0_g1_i1.p1 TRINITY_DN11762_c0_g1~~TRINITY_DN11762_c0_g1_i1.p1  ORF type:complete len:106 (-),score=20.17 TRINITY_DN11762_c0_g1_i1:67-384(-)
MCFFFQAEDGIRDFCLSRGLGDVYKRQIVNNQYFVVCFCTSCSTIGGCSCCIFSLQFNFLNQNTSFEVKINNFLHKAVSYTHLTLPTKRIVQISVVAVSINKKNE